MSSATLIKVLYLRPGTLGYEI